MKLIDALTQVGKQRPAWMTPRGAWKPPYVHNRDHILRMLGASKNVEKISKADLADMRSKLLTETIARSGKKRTVAGVNRIMSMMNTLLDDLYEMEIISAAPRLKNLKENNERKAYFKKHEVDQLVEQAKAQGKDELADAILFGAYTGCRQSELLNLVVGDVDLEGELMIFRDTKDGTDFETNISDHLKPLLAKRLRVKKSDERVFDFTSAGALRYAFYEVRDALGFDEEHVWHSLRHSTGTWLAEAGVPINHIAQVLNHKNVSTSERYVKRTSIQRKAAIAQL